MFCQNYAMILQDHGTSLQRLHYVNVMFLSKSCQDSARSMMPDLQQPGDAPAYVSAKIVP
jgi:hypothetical protein